MVTFIRSKWALPHALWSIVSSSSRKFSLYKDLYLEDVQILFATIEYSETTEIIVSKTKFYLFIF
jgi:hypothetical protein